MKNQYGIIYKATSPSGKVYIGQTTQTLRKRKNRHCRPSTLLLGGKFQNALAKYGPDTFTWEQIDTADTPEELNRKEDEWINKYDSIHSGYNVLNGGDCRTPEIKEKIAREKSALSAETVISIRQYLANGGTLRGTAKKFKVSKGTVADIKSGRKYAWAKGYYQPTFPGMLEEQRQAAQRIQSEKTKKTAEKIKEIRHSLSVKKKIYVRQSWNTKKALKEKRKYKKLSDIEFLIALNNLMPTGAA
jgi:group I intron endonuclease